MFTGKLQIKVCEASGLRPTDFQKRHNLTFGKLSDEQLIDPYVSIDVDESHFGKWSFNLRIWLCHLLIHFISSHRSFDNKTKDVRSSMERTICPRRDQCAQHQFNCFSWCCVATGWLCCQLHHSIRGPDAERVECARPMGE